MDLLDRLACPACHSRVLGIGDALACAACGRSFSVVDGVPQLVLPEMMTPAVEKSAAEWNARADEYHAVVGAVASARLAPIDLPLIQLARGDVLEVGCGDGRLMARLNHDGIASLIGIDLAPRMALLARRRGFATAVAMAERLPFPDRSFDVVLSGYYALRYADLSLALGELARVLRPGGRFGFTLLGRRAVGLAGRLAGLRLLFSSGYRAEGWRLLVDPNGGAVMPNDVASIGALRAELDARGLRADRVLGTPYVPWMTTLSWASGLRLPYVRDDAAARFGFDVIVLGQRA